MSTRNLQEVARETILAHIIAEFPADLDGITAERDAEVTTSPFEEFFISEESQAEQTPALYLIAGDFNQDQAAGGNHIIGTLLMNFICLVEAQDSELLTLKAERYTAALHETLDKECLVSANGKQKIVIKVKGVSTSPTFQNEENDGVFLKEGLLETEVEIRENF